MRLGDPAPALGREHGLAHVEGLEPGLGEHAAGDAAGSGRGRCRRRATARARPGRSCAGRCRPAACRAARPPGTSWSARARTGRCRSPGRRSRSPRATAAGSRSMCPQAPHWSTWNVPGLSWAKSTVSTLRCRSSDAAPRAGLARRQEEALGAGRQQPAVLGRGDWSSWAASSCSRRDCSLGAGGAHRLAALRSGRVSGSAGLSPPTERRVAEGEGRLGAVGSSAAPPTRARRPGRRRATPRPNRVAARGVLVAVDDRQQVAAAQRLLGRRRAGPGPAPGRCRSARSTWRPPSARRCRPPRRRRRAAWRRAGRGRRWRSGRPGRRCGPRPGGSC